MLNSCGHALSQGDWSDFNPGCNWEETPLGYSCLLYTSDAADEDSSV